MPLPVNAATNTPEPDNSQDHRAHIAAEHEKDAVEQVVHLMPVVLPIVGGVLMFLLAFIAIYMA